MYLFNKLTGYAITGALKGATLAGKGVVTAGRAAKRAIMAGVEAVGERPVNYVANKIANASTGTVRTAAKAAEKAMADAGDIANVISGAARPFVRESNNFLGFETKEWAGDLLFIGLAGVGAVGGIRQANLGLVNYGEMTSHAGATMTPDLQKRAVRANIVDNLGADGSLALALHHLRNG